MKGRLVKMKAREQSAAAARAKARLASLATSTKRRKRFALLCAALQLEEQQATMRHGKRKRRAI